MPSSLWPAPRLKSRRKGTLPFHWNGLTISCRPGGRVVDRRLEVDAADVVGVEGESCTGFARVRVALKVPKLTPLVVRLTVRVPPCLHVSFDEPRLIGREAVGHLLGQPLDGAGREDVRGVAFDELPELSRAERVAVHVR